MSLHLPRGPLAHHAVAAAALLALAPFGAPVFAADVDEITALTRPESSIRLGAGHVSDANQRFGQYTGQGEKGAYGLLDIDYLTRDNASGTWVRAFGRNLGLPSRELRLGYERQGDFNASIDSTRIPRDEPLVFTTGLAGIGTGIQVINGTARRDVTLGTVRDRVTVGFDKQLPGRFDLQVRLRHEEKDGTRLFGRGTGQFLVEPIGSRTHQVDAALGYTGDQLQVTAGYYGTLFSNRHNVMDVSTGTDIALAPDNQSHQLYLSGGYTLVPGTRASFKLSYGRGTQSESFYTKPDFAGNLQTSLHARVDTTAAQLGLTSRPLPGVTVLANLRYEDRDDKTPRHQFLAATTGRDGFNTPFSRTTTAGKLEASVQLPQAFRLTAGVDHDDRKRSVLAIRQASWRERNDETAYRLELRRSLSDTLNGALSVVRSKRGGSDYLPANNNAAADLIDPLHFADRDRDRVRLSLDWVPVEAASLQLMVDDARDTYPGRPLGPESGKARFWSVDGSYNFSDTWQAVAWASNDDTRITQSTNTGASGATLPAQTWQARLRNQGDAAGLGLRGKPSPRLEVGGDLQYSRDRNAYDLVATMPAAARLPDITSARKAIKLFGQYAWQDNLALRLELGHDQLSTNDWTWTGWTYADGTTVLQSPRGRITSVGVSLVYRMW